jgi:predicted type IV restriction endonuclease
MGFIEDIAKLSEKIRHKAEQVTGEEATKMAMIVPFINALGYDVYDPSEVMPEYVADFAIKKAGQFEKVDYAIAINGTIVMLIEAKSRGAKVESHDGQLSRYFNGFLTTKVGVVTNGIEYRFFTDLRNKNVMDKEPFFIFNILEYNEKDIENLKLFHRDNFDITCINKYAEEIVYVKGMMQLMGHLLRSPSDDFVRFLVTELGTMAPSYEIQGKITTKVIEKFKPIVKKSIQGSLVELMTLSLSEEILKPNPVAHFEEIEDATEQDNIVRDNSKIVTTAEELEAFEKINIITKKSSYYHSDIEVKYKDTTAYFGIHIGKVTWWIFRLYLSGNKKTIITRLSVDEVKLLTPDFPVQEISASIGDAKSKITISSVSDFDRLTPLILRCYELEAGKRLALVK